MIKVSSTNLRDLINVYPYDVWFYSIYHKFNNKLTDEEFYKEYKSGFAIDPIKLIQLIEKPNKYFTDMERTVLYKYYKEGKTLDKIAEEIDRTRERVRQIKNKAERILTSKACVYNLFRTVIYNDYLIMDNHKNYDDFVNENNKIFNIAIKYTNTYRQFQEALEIKNIYMSTKLRNCLVKSNYKSLLEFLGWNINDLIYKIRGFGENCKDELIKILNSHNMYINENGVITANEDLKKGYSILNEESGEISNKNN